MADEISRDALSIYLEDICIMETIITQSKKRLRQIEEKISAEETKFF